MHVQQIGVLKKIMRKCVTEKSLANYDSQNACFAMFCLEDEMWFVKKLLSLCAHLKKYAQACLLKCSPEDDNCPFILSNLTIAQFSLFLSTHTSCQGKNKGKANLLGHASYDKAKIMHAHHKLVL